MQPTTESSLRKLTKKLNRLFDPRLVSGPESFSLKYPVAEEPPGAPVRTQLEVAPDTPLHRLQVRSGAAVETVTMALEALQGDLSTDVELNLGRLKAELNVGSSVDIVVRALNVPCVPPLRAYVIYIDGVVNGREVEEAIIEPLLGADGKAIEARGADLLLYAETSLMAIRQTQRVYKLSTLVEGIVSGQAGLLLESAPGALVLEARGWPGRGVEKPITEAVIKGPHEAFNETIRINTALIRRRLMTPDLVFERVQLGRRSRTDLCLGYLKSVANPDLLDELRRRLATIDVDVLTDSGMLQQFLEHKPKALFPVIGSTERPDRAAAALAEGRAVLLQDGSPYILMVPWLFGDFYHNPEDYYIKWPFGTFLRVVRAVGALVALLLPALYIAISNFHHEMIPSSLLLAIAATREAVPFPAPIEVAMMEVVFEIIREGSLRIPSVLGQTVGIVGALILGQAAVQAAIVSPILIIVVALTALGSFTIPNYEMGLVIRLLRFLFIGLGTTFGLYGIAIGLLVVSTHAAGMRSFGVPYLAPEGPRLKTSPDVLVRGPLPALEQRPSTLRPLDSRRQAQDVSAGAPGTGRPGAGDQ